MILGDVALLAGDTLRARAYLSRLVAADLLPARILLLPPMPGAPGPRATVSSRFDAETPLAEAARAADVPVEPLPEADVNSPAVVRSVRQSGTGVLVWAGYAGVLLGRELLATGHRFLHVHPGWLPDYRGSTTLYYSLLAQREVAASALLLTSGIDEGPVLGRRRYPVPADRMSLDGEYDAYVRADLLVGVLDEYARSGRFAEEAQRPDDGTTYYIIHPVLKHIALLGGGDERT